MKERIVQKLIQLAKPPHDRSEEDASELGKFADDLNMKKEELCEQAEKCLNAILHNYGMFSVMTIDKFTHKVIRTFAKELGLSLDFEVELDLDALRKNVADLLYDRIGRDDEITVLMMHYAKSNLQEDKSWNFRKTLMDFSKQLFKEDAIEAIKELKDLKAKDFIDAQEQMIKEREIFAAKSKKMAQEALDLLPAKGLTFDDFVGKGGNQGIMKAFAKMAHTVEPFSEAKVKQSKADEWGHPQSPNKDEANALTPLLKQYFQQIEQLYADEYPRYMLNKELLKFVNDLSLLNHLLSITEEIKEQDNVLLISDFYKTISEVITKEPVPFIYERLGVRYEHFLLDEFQDTSHLQWVNLVPLLHNSVSMGHDNLIVGDGKQAIYRWRNGEVEQFIQLPEKVYNPTGIQSLKEAEITFKQLGKPEVLGSNYRSAPEIVSFNNALFQNLANDKHEDIQKIYAKNEQEAVKKHQGYLEFMCTEEKDDEPQLEYILEVVNRSLDKDYELKDICVLVNTNKNGTKVARYLNANGIKVISQDSLFVSKDLHVRFVFNLICSLANKSNLNFAKKCIEQYDKIFELQQHLFDLLEEKKINILDWFKAEGYELKPNEQFHSFYEYIEHIISVFDLDVSNNVYLQFFLEQVHHYEKRHNSNIHSFVEWFNEVGFKESIQSPEGANSVKIMTIHKSKGLQFPIVIGAFFDWNIKDNKSRKWIVDQDGILPAFPLKITENTRKSVYKTEISDEDLKHELDQINLLYVALTRPETALFVSGSTKKTNSLFKVWLQPFIDEYDQFTDADDKNLIGTFANNANPSTSEDEHLHFEFCKQTMEKPKLSTSNGDQWDIHDLDKRREFGTHLHLLLSKVNSLKEVDSALKKLIMKGKIPADFETQITEITQSLFQDDHFASYFNQANVMNEKVIIDENGNKHIPDKLILSDDGLLVIDFKTGEEHIESHAKQVKNYMNLLKDFGYLNVKGEIYYTERKEVISVN